MTARFPLLLMCLAAFAVLGTRTNAQPAELPMPDAPLALAGGETVSLAWSLPPAPKVDMVVIYRSGKEAAGLSEVARVNGSDLQWTDKDVALGRTYEYRIQTLKGAKNSGISGHVEVTVGDSARITFIGGSVDRALFEVMMFRRGRRVSSRFIHKPGDPIGDLSYVPDLDTIEDFRLGPRLLKLDIGVAETRETSSETLGDASGQTMKDLGGREVRIDFTYPGATNEVMIATILDAQDRPVKLKEGESYKTD